MTIAGFVIGAVLVSIFSYGVSNINSEQMKGAVAEKEREVTVSMMTHGLSSYYYSHNGEYPEEINKDVLQIMGLQGLNLKGFEYKKNLDGTYSLRYEEGMTGNITGYTGSRTE